MFEAVDLTWAFGDGEPVGYALHVAGVAVAVLGDEGVGSFIIGFEGCDPDIRPLVGSIH